MFKKKKKEIKVAEEPIEEEVDEEEIKEPILKKFPLPAKKVRVRVSGIKIREDGFIEYTLISQKEVWELGEEIELE